MTRTKREVWEEAAHFWYEDARRAELAGNTAEYERCWAMYKAYKADLQKMGETK